MDSRSIGHLRRGLAALAASALVASALVTPALSAPSGGLRHLAQVPVVVGSDLKAQGSDLAFQRNMLVAGSYQGVGFFRLRKGAPPQQVSFFPCPGAQGDVSIWNDLVIVSKEDTSDHGLPGTPCNEGGIGGSSGIRVLDVSDVRHPRQVAFVPLPCGSHTNTLVPQRGKLLVYAAALRTSDATNSNRPGAPCNRSARQGFSIVEVPLANPERAALVSDYDSLDGDGCHDVTVVPARDLAIAACGFTDTQLLDISDPLAPVLLSRIVNPAMQFHHQAMLTWDGKYLALSDEAPAGGCAGSVPGSIWFYDVTDPAAPKEAGRYQLPRVVPPAGGGGRTQCWAHNFNIVPMRDGRYVLVAGFYGGGLTIVDFSDPAAPVELAHDAPQDVDMWGAYWYDGLVYTMDWGSRRGLGVYELPALGRGKTLSFGPRLNPQVQTLSR